MKTDPSFALELNSILNLSYTNTVIVEQLTLSIQNSKEKLEQYYQQKQLASIETEGSYELMIKRTIIRMEKDEKDLVNILTKSKK